MKTIIIAALMFGVVNPIYAESLNSNLPGIYANPKGTEIKNQVKVYDLEVVKLDVFEAVFRYQFKYNGAGAQQPPAYYLELMEKDPSEAFLARFKGHVPPVRKSSEFVERKGLKFWVESIEWGTNGQVVVFGGYYEGGMSASGNQYTVIRQDHKWIVIKDEMIWIS